MFACTSICAAFDGVTMIDSLAEIILNQSNCWLFAQVLESYSEDISLTCWKSLVWLPHSDSQNINDVMQKPFRSSVAAACWANMRSIPHQEPPQISSEVSVLCITAVTPWCETKPSVSLISPLFLSYPVFGMCCVCVCFFGFFFFVFLIPTQCRTFSGEAISEVVQDESKSYRSLHFHLSLKGKRE